MRLDHFFGVKASQLAPLTFGFSLPKQQESINVEAKCTTMVPRSPYRSLNWAIAVENLSLFTTSTCDPRCRLSHSSQRIYLLNNKDELCFFFFFFEIDSEKAEGHTALCRCVVVQMLRGPTYQIVVAVIDPKSASYPLLWPRNVHLSLLTKCQIHVSPMTLPTKTDPPPLTQTQKSQLRKLTTSIRLH